MGFPISIEEYIGLHEIELPRFNKTLKQGLEYNPKDV